METLQPDDPRELGSYRMLRRLGAGGMGRVYLARSPGGRTVAVKVVRPDLAADAGFRDRFRHEVEIAKAVSGRYTAPVVDADPNAALPWLATSYVLGPDLTDVVDAHGAMPERTVRALAAGLAAALQEIHAAGLIHRDLKPSNVLLAADGPRVIDFGIARAVDGNRMTQTGVVVGSPGYMPPEQALGQDVGPAGDVFSLGGVLAFAANGRGAFGAGAASHAALLYQVVHGEPDLADVPPSLLGLIRACLQKDPAQRPAPAEIVAALAPQGVEGVLRDWLPSAVSSTIATHAAGILDLEAPQPPQAPGYGYPPAPPAPGYGAPMPSAPGYGYPPAPGYGPPQPGTVQLGSAPAASSAPSRRRVLSLALGGAAAVAGVGGGAAWWLGSGGDSSTEGKGTAAGKGASARPAEDSFTTPPAGVAPQPLWRKKVAEDSTSSAVPLLTHDGLLLISGDPLVAYDVKTGKVRWSKPGVCRPGAPLLFRDGRVYLADGDYDGELVAYDVKTGEETWRSQLGSKLSLEKAIAVDDQYVYVTATDYSDFESATEKRSSIAAVSRVTGTRVWIWDRDEDTGKSTEDYDVLGSVSGDYLVYAGSDNNLSVRKTILGVRRWTKKIGDDWAGQPTVAKNLVFLPGETLRAVDVETGKVRWTLKPNGRRGFNNPTVIDGVLYVSDYDGGVWAVDINAGKRIWLCDELDISGPETFVKKGTSLYGATGSLDGGLVALNAGTGKLRWTYTDSDNWGEQWQVALSGNRLLVTNGPEIYALPAV
ncbi:serine/threonine-protein kinase [Streptomyces fulvoviolaceus]|uniref:serine/threonine-protein kinase n=1 Tax=Streptomyces fulvoviolaceus TaxID=285535 RepID=UPI0021C0B493|nr:PQQ-binding-like beta-propeller repeat protein [Streptomyces fulvoviolaceus]MCT9083978.1 PQQ-binding-like beta-propeller repeat protein [Streptomyces fulvoviolaceus]